MPLCHQVDVDSDANDSERRRAQQEASEVRDTDDSNREVKKEDGAIVLATLYVTADRDSVVVVVRRMEYADANRAEQNDQGRPVVHEPAVLLAQTLDQEANDDEVDVVEQDGALLFQILDVEHELNDQCQHEQYIDIFEVAERDGAAKLEELGLCFLVAYAQRERVDGLVPRLFDTSYDFLLTLARAVA